MPKVRTRMQPGVEIEVPEEELAVLTAMDLLADEPAPETATAAPAAVKTKAKADSPAAAPPDPAPPADAATDGADTTKKKG